MEDRLNALVTGASRGIGRAIAIALAKRNVRVAVHYRSSAQQANSLCTELPGTGHRAIQADLADRSARFRLFDESVQRFGALDILVNNAGVFDESSLIDLSRQAWCEKWRGTLGVNLDAAADLTFSAAQHMAARQRGRIVNITSRGAFRGEPQAPEYGASKAGLNSLSQSFAQAFAPRGVCVFAVAPGFVATDMASEYLKGERGRAIRAQSPLDRVAQPEEIAQVTAYLALDAPTYMTGAILDVNGASYLRN